MEQAVNQFNKGLQMDTNPMVQGNDSLSDALNATFMTMNGNEVILQNDMGNRRVDGAFLPPGYQPVGMKEYGGIIYVASYNPITNRSQIGSFPSPERNIQPNEIEGFKEINIDQIYTESTKVSNCFYTKDEDGIPFLVNRSFLIPITDDTSLHAGDKFTIYSEQLYSIKDSITNFNNIEGEKVKSPKNKKYTLSLGVMNSQNEFVDITNSLVRWDENGEIIDTSNDSDLIKFNKGYFIAPFNYIKPNGTIADNTYIENREVMPINTYSFKLIGPLYLKTTLNTIQGFTYSMSVTKNNDDFVILVRGNLTYNCPDGVTESESVEDEDYYTLETGSNNLNIKGFTLFIENERNNEQDPLYSSLNESEISYSSTSYNKETNLYSLTLTKKFIITGIENENPIINYYLCVSDTDEYYLKELSLKGIINTSLIGSGELNINIWRYKWGENEKILNYEISAYPRSGEKFQNLTLHYKGLIHDTEEEHQISLINGEITSGYYNENITPLQENEMYLVYLSYDIVSEITGETTKYIGNSLRTINGLEAKRLWILTTPYFNKYYNTILDFSSIEQENVDYSFGEKIEIEDITYNTYTGLNNNSYYSTDPIDKFDFLNNITANISLKASFNDKDNLEDIGLPKEMIKVINTSASGNPFDIYIPNSINSNSGFTGELKINEEESLGTISNNINLNNIIGFSIGENNSDQNANSNYQDGISPTQCKLTLVFINYAGNFTSGTITIEDNNPASFDSSDLSNDRTFTVDQIDRNSEVTISITGTESMGVYGLQVYERTFTITDDTTLGFMFTPIHLGGRRASENEVSITDGITDENSIHIQLYNNQSTSIEAQFTQPFIMGAVEKTNVPVENYLISIKNYLQGIIDTQLHSPQIEIEHYNNINKFCIERGAYSTNTIKSDSNPDVIKQYTLNSNNELHLKSEIASYSEGFNQCLGNLNVVLIAGVGEDRSSTQPYDWVLSPEGYNLQDISQASQYKSDAEIYVNSITKSAIKIWMKYKNDLGQDCWAILAEGYVNYGEDVPYSTLRNQLKSFISSNNIKNDFYGNFGTEVRNTDTPIYMVHNRNYYLLKDFSIILPVIVEFKKDITLSNILLEKEGNENLISKLPKFFTNTGTKIIKSEIKINSINQTNNIEFIDTDVYNLLGKTSIKYWADTNSSFFNHLSEINPENNLFEVLDEPGNNNNGSILSQYNQKEIEGFGPSLPVIFDNRIKYIFQRDQEYYKDTDPILYYDCPRIAFDLPHVNPSTDLYYASFSISTNNN